MSTKRSRHSERQRYPQPLIKRRIASGRGAMEQPNATGDPVELTVTFWVALLLTAVATGLFGDLLMWILTNAERVAFGYRGGNFGHAVARTSDLRRVVSLVAAGVLGSIVWFSIRRYLRHEKSEIDDAIWEGDGSLSIRRSFLTSVISEIVIGMGASIGREAAPKLMGGASGSQVATWLKLSVPQRRLLVACGGGAGLAAVYNVPLGGAIFTLEVLYGSFALPVALPALACSTIATLTAWIYLPRTATYPDIPAYHFSQALMVWSIPAGIVIGAFAVIFVRLIGWVSFHRATGAQIFFVMPAAFALVGVIGIWYPQLFGNGKDMAHEAFLGLGTAGLLAMMFALKPIVTALCLGSGAAGGVFTPFLSIGACLGACLGVMWAHLWPGTSVGACALIGAGAMIGAAMQAPLAGLVLVLELTHSGLALAVPMISATVIATLLVRHVDGYSIYTARLPRRHDPSAPDEAPGPSIGSGVDG